jgi:hypothetical protein
VQPKDSKDNEPVVKFKGLHYKKAILMNQGHTFSGECTTTIVNQGDLQRFSGEGLVMKSRPAEAEDCESPFKNKGNHFSDDNNHHGTDRVWSVYNIHRKKKDTKVTKKVERNKSPFRASKDGTKKHHSPKAAEEGLLNSFYKENECKTAKSS